MGKDDPVPDAKREERVTRLVRTALEFEPSDTDLLPTGRSAPGTDRRHVASLEGLGEKLVGERT